MGLKNNGPQQIPQQQQRQQQQQREQQQQNKLHQKRLKILFQVR